MPISTDTMPEMEDTFRLMVENSHDILTIRDADGRLRYANPSYYRLLGYKPEEVVGSTCFDLIHPEDRDRVLAALARFMKSPGTYGSIRCRVRHADGSWIPFELTAYNMLDHPVIRGLVINSRYISKRVQQETGSGQLTEEWEHSPASLHTLTEILTVCASCKKIRNRSGAWEQIEVYIRDRAPVEFSHGMCPECVHLWSRDDGSEDLI